MKLHIPVLHPIFCFSLAIILLTSNVAFVCGGEVGKSANKAGMANPASIYCLEKGGKLDINKRNDGGEYGVCIFEDNRQCEEWALFRGECPDGGVRVTGCVTPAALYCAITGGHYSEISLGKNTDERGTCSFKNGASCDAWDYYDGKCSK
jgi:putative hemolysin